MSASVSVAGTVVHFAEAVKLLGVSCMTLDSALTFITVVSETVNILLGATYSHSINSWP